MIWHALTAILVVLKLLEMITVSWVIVLMPSIISTVVSFLFVVLFVWAKSK